LACVCALTVWLCGGCVLCGATAAWMSARAMCGICCVVPATERSDSGNTNSAENNNQNFMTLGRYSGGNSVGIYDEDNTPTATMRTVCEVDLL
jgi:hypothetical protein